MTLSTSYKSQNKFYEVSATQRNKLVDEDLFVLARAQNPFTNNEKYDARIHHGDVVRISNANNGEALHSSDLFFKQGEISEYKEVYGSSEGEKNDRWIVYLVLNNSYLAPLQF